MKVRITDVHPSDNFHHCKQKWIGKVGNFIDSINELAPEGYSSGRFEDVFFYAVKYELVPEYSIEYPGGTMNQDGTVTKIHEMSLREAMDRVTKSTNQLAKAFSNKPQRKSWLQKIRDYDNLQSRCNSAEAMRDHYKTSLESWESLAISKARELELMSKVADNWQQRLICVQKDIMDATEMIGKRLKFSVGHNHFEIIVGNPVTACYFVEKINGDKYDDNFFSVSICHKNDKFDWRRGVVESLDNMIRMWLGTAYGDPADYFNTLFTAYPEIGIQPVVKPVKKTKKAK